MNIDFSKAIADLQKMCIESLDLNYKSVDLNIKNKAIVQIYFMFQAFQEHSHCYDKRKN